MFNIIFKVNESFAMKTAISCIYEQIFLEPELTLLKIALLASLYLSICAGRGKKKIFVQEVVNEE